jgi:hypothetical protein
MKIIENGVIRDARSDEIAQRELDNLSHLEKIKEQYRNDRAMAYPPIGDQLDSLFKAGVFPVEMALTIQAVKDKYPKPQN